MKISRADVAVALALAAVVAVWLVQWFVTSPGEITFIEFRLALLVAGPAIITSLTAHWVDAARRPREDDDQ